MHFLTRSKYAEDVNVWLSEDTVEPIVDAVQTTLFQLFVVTTILQWILLYVRFRTCLGMLVELTRRTAGSKERIHMYIVKLSPTSLCDRGFLQQWVSAVISRHTQHMGCHQICPSHPSATLKLSYFNLLILILYYRIYTVKFILCMFYKVKWNMGGIIIIRCHSCYSD